MGALLDGAVPLKQPAQMNLVNRELVYRGNYSAAVAMHIGAKHQFKSCAFRWLCVSNRIVELFARSICKTIAGCGRDGDGDFTHFALAILVAMVLTNYDVEEVRRFVRELNPSKVCKDSRPVLSFLDSNCAAFGVTRDQLRQLAPDFLSHCSPFFRASLKESGHWSIQMMTDTRGAITSTSFPPAGFGESVTLVRIGARQCALRFDFARAGLGRVRADLRAAAGVACVGRLDPERAAHRAVAHGLRNLQRQRAHPAADGNQQGTVRGADAGLQALPRRGSELPARLRARLRRLRALLLVPPRLRRQGLQRLRLHRAHDVSLRRRAPAARGKRCVTRASLH